MSYTRLLSVGGVCFCAGGLYGWSALIAPLQASFDVSTARTGLVFSIAIVCFTLAVTATPYVAVHAPPLRRLAVFSWAAALSLLFASIAPSYPVFVLCFSAGFGTASGAIYISAVAIAAQSSRPLRATPLMVAAFGIGGAVFGPAWRMLEGAAWGLTALLPLAIALFVSGVAVWIVPERKEPHTKVPPYAEELSAVGPSVQSMIWVIFACGSFGGLMVLGLAGKMLDVAGASLTVSSLALASVALGNTVGRMSVAGFSQVFAPIVGVFISLGLGTSGLLITLSGLDGVVLAAGLCLIAVGYGVMASAIPTLTRSVYGATRFQSRFALIFTAWGLAGFCAPWVAGMIFDETGSFDLAIYIAMCTMALSFAGACTLQINLSRMQRE